MSIVTPIRECPSNSIIARGCVPWASSNEAVEWRRSWIRISGSSAFLQNGLELSMQITFLDRRADGGGEQVVPFHDEPAARRARS